MSIGGSIEKTLKSWRESNLTILISLNNYYIKLIIMSTSLRSVPEVRLSQINEAREKSNLIKRTLISILNGETTEDAALLRECEEL